MIDTGLFSTTRPILTTSQLLGASRDSHELTAAVRSGQLIRVRRGHYALPGTVAHVLEAVRVGGRLGCVSAAAAHGLWVPDEPFAHVSLRRDASRLRSPRDRFRRLTPETLDGVELHWWPVAAGGDREGPILRVEDALAQVIRCQPRPLALAVLDSALHERKVTRRQLDGVFARVPEKYRGLRAEVDGRSMSGIETIVRLIALDAGLRCELQVRFDGVGAVDLLIDGCVVIEVDGREWHEGQQPRDYDRDLRLAVHGMTVLRVSYRQAMFEPWLVLAAMRAAVDARRRP